MFNVGDTLLKLATESGFAGFFANGGWQNLVMIVIACVLLYLGIVKGFEPLLLVGIAFGCLLANVSYFPGLDAVNPDLNATNAMYHPELWSAFLDSTSPYYHSYGHILSNAGLLASRISPRNLLPRPSPLEAPFTRPAMSTNSRVAGVNLSGS